MCFAFTDWNGYDLMQYDMFDFGSDNNSNASYIHMYICMYIYYITYMSYIYLL